MQDTIENALPEAPAARMYYRAREVAALTGLGLRTIYEGIYAGWIPSRKIGNSRLIPAAWLHAATDPEADAVAAGGSNMPKYQYTLAFARAAARAIASAAKGNFLPRYICRKFIPLGI